MKCEVCDRDPPEFCHVESGSWSRYALCDYEIQDWLQCEQLPNCHRKGWLIMDERYENP